MSFIQDLTTHLNSQSNSENASYMTDYMRGKFIYYGVKTKERRDILKQASLKNITELKSNVRSLALELYKLPERELHLFAIEILQRHLKKSYQEKDIDLIKTIITTNSWWDTVDFIAKQILGDYLLQFPDQLMPVISDFSKAKNLWLNRSTLIFQLGYKHNTNEELLFNQCLLFKTSEEFFIQKAIGWSLREYAKINPKSVLNFVNSNQLKPLSHREAIKNISL